LPFGIEPLLDPVLELEVDVVAAELVPELEPPPAPAVLLLVAPVPLVEA
jgi:hypothetical protein